MKIHKERAKAVTPLTPNPTSWLLTQLNGIKKAGISQKMSCVYKLGDYRLFYYKFDWDKSSNVKMTEEIKNVEKNISNI